MGVTKKLRKVKVEWEVFTTYISKYQCPSCNNVFFGGGKRLG